jgi:hypothetical protein
VPRQLISLWHSRTILTGYIWVYTAWTSRPGKEQNRASPELTRTSSWTRTPDSGQVWIGVPEQRLFIELPALPRRSPAIKVAINYIAEPHLVVQSHEVGALMRPVYRPLANKSAFRQSPAPPPSRSPRRMVGMWPPWDPRPISYIWLVGTRIQGKDDNY